MCGSALLLGDVAQFVQLLLTRQYAPHGRQKAARKDIPIAGRTQNTRHPLQCVSYPHILLGWQHTPRRRDNRTKATRIWWRPSGTSANAAVSQRRTILGQ